MNLIHSGAALLLSITLGCGGGGGEPTTPGTPNTPYTPGTPNTPGTPATGTEVSVRDNSYSPAATSVKVGNTVTWTWAAGNYSSHTVSFSDGSASADQTTGTFSRTFNAAGTFNYQCAIHGASMSGSVVVQP